MRFSDLGLDPAMLEAVDAMGYTEPTPIQRESIPHVLAGRDVVGCAQTGTGKTAAFVLPVLQRLGARRDKRPRVLVVTPTRELALQIEEVARSCSRSTRQTSAVVYGGVGYEPQRTALKRGIDVLIACPGRLLDLVGTGHADLSGIEILVLDEADRMLDMGFWPDVRRILSHLPERRQTLLFSATMSPDVLRVIGGTLHDPVQVSVAPPATPIEAIDQRVYPVAADQKVDLLVRLLEERDLDRVLIFTRTKHRADKVCRNLGRSRINGAAIHGNRSQAQRQKALDGFKSGQYRVLVATDVVARGIDVDDISHVINFDLPNIPEDYVHRIGRTARAGATGTAISFLAQEEREHLTQIERMLGVRLPMEDVDGFDYAQRHVPEATRPIAIARTNGNGGKHHGSGVAAGGGGAGRPAGASGQRRRRRRRNGSQGSAVKRAS
jgi:ATP-dependent RNA helicase RhlE